MKSILAISGSLRSGSSSHAILHFLRQLVPPGITFTIYDNLAQIPPFDPGLDHESPPDTVVELRSFINHADALVICTPEYAFGIPGQLKNSLDWMVSSGTLADKPVALITASSSGEYAHPSLLRTLGALSANVIESASLLISFIRSKMDSKGDITDAQTEKSLRAAFNTLLKEIESK